jgi:tetraacyldisaccharide 4'-kinase
VPHVQAPDRAAAARQAIEQFAAQAILLDDGFQHRRLARDLDIVLLDALAPLGYGHVFPRGLLREPATELRRADCAVLSRADMLEAPARAAIRDQVRRLAPAAAWAEVAHRPLGLQSATGRPEGARSLAGRPVAAFCGTGQPAAFWRTLESLGCRIAARREFPDHHAYTGNDLDELARWADAADCAAVLTTHKDLVKIGRDRLGQRPLWALLIGVEFLAGQAEFAALLAPLVRSANHAGGGHA